MWNPSRHTAFVLGLTLFQSVFLGMPMLLLACFEGLSLTTPMQAASVVLPLQIFNALMSRRPAWSFSVVLNLVFTAAYTGWIATRSFPVESPVQPIYLFYTLSVMQMFVLIAILYQLLCLAEYTPEERFLVKPTAVAKGGLKFTFYWVLLYLSTALLIAETILIAFEPDMNLHLMLFFTHVWPYLSVALLLKQKHGLRAIEWLGIFICIWQILHSLVIIAFEMGPLWARILIAGGFAPVHLASVGTMLYFSSTRFESMPPVERLAILLREIKSTC